jgi:large subunit ribosomal protein L10
MARPEKVASVEEIRSKLGSASAAVLTEYRGLKVAELATLRASLRAADAEYKVFKNTLARRAAEEEGMPELAEMLSGPTAITFVKGDAVGVAKALRDFSKINPLLVIKGGLLGTRVIRPADVSALADIEPREVLLAKLAGAMQAPLVKAAGLFQALPRSMAYGLKALIDQRVAGGEALPAEQAVAEEAPAEAAAEAPPVAAPTEDFSAEAVPGTEETPGGTAEGLVEVAEEVSDTAGAPAEAAEAEAPAPAAAEEAPEAAADVPADPDAVVQALAADAPADADAVVEALAAEAPAEAEAVEEAPTAAEVDGPAESAEATEEPAAEAAPSEESTE